MRHYSIKRNNKKVAYKLELLFCLNIVRYIVKNKFY